MTYASLLITTYNRMELLGESLSSLYENTYYPYELIIHDDGSKPRMVEWLCYLLQNGQISELILNPTDHNRGQALATDRAFAISSGDYIVKLEGDEQFAPGWLDRAVRAMELFPEIGQLSLMQFGVTDWARTAQERVRYPDWHSFVLKGFQREDVKIAVVWCSPGGQFMVRRKLWKETGDWYQGHPDQETIAFRMRLCPMARLLKGFDPQRPPPEDKEAHWAKYRYTPWLAVLDPPVLSTHWGSGRTMLFRAQETLQNQPVLSYKAGIPNYSVQRGDRFGPMPGYNCGRDLP